MKNNKLIIFFLIKFFVVYFILTGLYSLYLKNAQIREQGFSCAPITSTVAYQSGSLTRVLGYETQVYQNTGELSMAYKVNGKYVAIVVEGCTAVSIMILFLSFIVAFSGKLKHTLFFGLFGLITIYCINVARVSILGILLYHFPEHQKILHDLVFPAIIYGYVFSLWVIWVRKFATINKKEDVKEA